MPSEAKRAFWRIGTTYIRLFLTLLLGLILVRMLLAGVGNQAFGLLALLGSTIGIAALVETVTRECLVRELAAAHHAKAPEAFNVVFSSATVVALGMSIGAAAVYFILFFLVPQFNIPPELWSAARWFIVFKAIEGFIRTLLSPQLNMYIVTERLVLFNIWKTFERSGDVFAALVVVLAAVADPAMGVVVYGAISTGLIIGVLVAAVIWIRYRDPRLHMSLGAANRPAIMQILRVGGWNLAAVSAAALHLPLGALLMNLGFGLWGNLIFGIASQLANYGQRLALGAVTGVEAVSARIAVIREQEGLRLLVYHTSRLQALMMLPAMAGIAILAEPLLGFWLGGRLDEPAANLPNIVAIVRVLAVGVVAKSISDGWMRILYGAGYVRRYAPIIFTGGLINPLLAVGLIFMLPERLAFLGPAWAYSVVLLSIHLLLLGRVVSQVLAVEYVAILKPLVKPAILTALSVPVLLGMGYWTEQWTLHTLLASVGMYLALYMCLATVVVLQKSERQRLVRALLAIVRSNSKNHAAANRMEPHDMI